MQPNQQQPRALILQERGPIINHRLTRHLVYFENDINNRRVVFPTGFYDIPQVFPPFRRLRDDEIRIEFWTSPRGNITRISLSDVFSPNTVIYFEQITV